MSARKSRDPIREPDGRSDIRGTTSSGHPVRRPRRRGSSGNGLLNIENAKKLREELGRFVEAGRKRAKSGKTYHRTSVAPDPRAVRAWAESNGFEVPARGRIPKKVYDAFNAAR